VRLILCIYACLGLSAGGHSAGTSALQPCALDSCGGQNKAALLPTTLLQVESRFCIGDTSSAASIVTGGPKGECGSHCSTFVFPSLQLSRTVTISTESSCKSRTGKSYFPHVLNHVSAASAGSSGTWTLARQIVGRNGQNVAASAFAIPPGASTGQRFGTGAFEHFQSSKCTPGKILSRSSAWSSCAFRHQGHCITLSALVSRRNHG
jgi:hypothetical protein